MLNRDSEFTNLTKAQVEALLECFDFLRNGYQPVIDYNVKDTWFIKLRLRGKNVRLTVQIMNREYFIYKNGELVKYATFERTPARYKMFVNSDLSVGVVRLAKNGNQDLVSG